METFDDRLRRYVYQHFVWEGRAPDVREMSAALSRPIREIRAGLERLARSHAFVLQDDGELWRAAPFSAAPTPFAVRMGRSLWWGTCIWDALGIPAMLQQDARIEASCGCCNNRMVLNASGVRLSGPKGIVHFAVPARDWYADIVFT